ncbi:phosphoribosylformylglycinamidine synthase [Riemerella anatipestifer]|uniref:Phosphoribosylformylglycinamidine synthase n=1 Tax=Riemerella anatipestifer TaxID=34085 RepID=A0AAP3AKE6_RIEAN|nr:HAEPLYID family protein [Riemerella anatipestifer]AZZ57886.1 phosphoribosylformylglycinamidine synthase [Riemerella anatipestifer]MBT0572015.1 phosphoribosylformylglycinamidine synthase [Riemerella anatipestifer]MCU7567661.1 phosphoribosylformylglycinamidine synthase [Riemerella anatipestifer]MCW0489652.1 phosphoribosylformylglycinamidine synthase [Riemerella anatipestifer]MCW0510470.1 phosphoribosylformylglycinamidine synthase [Riemerella anatipestifer]
MNFKRIMLLALVLIFGNVFSQNIKNEKDSLYIAEVEDTKEPAKVLHAEPLYIDLIRDLGARKGEKEWNLGLGLTDKLNFDAYEALVEYEWAPIDRLGLEVELPFTFYSPTGNERVQAPSSKLNSLKLALQWSFLVNEEKATTMALGYINELEFSDFGRFGKPLIKGNVYNPFFVVAKRWGNNFHTLVYTGPMIEQSFITNKFHMVYDVHSSFHYMISGTRNFVGVEFNKTFDRGNFDMVMRPQMRLGILEQLMLGVVVGIPVSRENERLSSFLRLIWEPKH